MLVSSKKMLLKAQKEGYAIGAFNISNLETLKAIMAAAEAKRSPVILAIAEGSISYAGLPYIFNLAKTAAEISDIPVAIHLDHGRTVELAEKCLEIGFNSLMIDASEYDYSKNVEITKKVVDLAHAKNVSVEGEIGRLGEDKTQFSNPEEVKKFVEETGVDFVAVGVGTRHGWTPEEKIDLDLLSEIHQAVSIPLVLHGASGAKDDDIRRAISKGVAKINIHTEIRRAFIEGIKKGLAENPTTNDHREILKYSIGAMQKAVEDKIELFGSSEKAQSNF